MEFTSNDLKFLEELGIDCSHETTKKNHDTKVVVGMSGGVDSSVAALICLAQGFDVLGVFMKNWEDDDENCPSAQDFQDVVSVCEKLGIDYYAVNFAKEYFDQVFEDFVSDYKKGRTPNPDILCNSKIKFNVFFNYAKNLGADYLATGHYARISKDGFLLKGLDQAKDQSYFLYRVPEKVWGETLFPLGEIEKTNVRKIADHFGLSTSTKKDSTGICFIGEKKFREFLSQYMQSQKGYFKTLDGEIVGEHKGQCYYTPGQRRGLGLGGPGQRWYVVKKDTESNDVFVVRGDDHPSLYIDELLATDLVGQRLLEIDKTDLHCKIRYRQADQECHVKREGDKLIVKFPHAQKGVATGQSIVFYQGSTCIGGAIIDQLGPSHYDKELNIKGESWISV